jgi:8-hydroxy-5-deazaflavin:NADPH oxidoreductase
MAAIRIAVLGAGNIGGTLGRKWARAGHAVTFGVTDPAGAKAQAVLADLGNLAQISTVADALAGAEVVLVAVPGTAVDALVQANADQLDGKIVIDAANRLSGGPANSLATFQRLTPNARVYRAFNTLGWENFAHPMFDGIEADLFYCGPDGESRQVVERLIEDVGLRPIRLGDTDQVDLVDAMLRVWFALAVGQGMGRQMAFKVLTR